MKKIFIPLFLLTLFNCSKSENQHELSAQLVDVVDEDKVVNYNIPPPPPPKQEVPISSMASAKEENSEPKVSAPENNVIAKKIIKNGEIEIQVGDIKKSSKSNQ